MTTMQSGTIVVFIATVFFKKAAITIATHDQKTLHSQLSKVNSLVCTAVILRQ